MECNFEIYPPRKTYEETTVNLDQTMGIIKLDELYDDIGGEG